LKIVPFFVNSNNLGRGKNRNDLAKKAKHEWILFMDCDTFPSANDFIQKYIFQINKDEKIIYGGIKYKKEKPNDDQLLRWFYGHARESLSAKIRKTKPNTNALVSNLLICRKNLISNIFDESITQYGYEDLVFLSDLKKKGSFCKTYRKSSLSSRIRDFPSISRQDQNCY